VREHKDKAKSAAARTARRTAIAKGLIQQKTATVVAQELGISRKTLYQELAQPETQALIRSMMAPHHKRLERIVDQSISAVERALTADQEARLRRVEWLTDRIERLRRVIEERALEAETDADLANVPGMQTGLMVHRTKALGSFGVTTEYEIDTGLLSELRAHEEQLREELNNFTPNLKAVERARDLLEMAEGKRTDGDGGDDLPRKFSGTMEELLVLYRKVTTGESSAPAA
jgi:hypothetical protein